MDTPSMFFLSIAPEKFLSKTIQWSITFNLLSDLLYQRGDQRLGLFSFVTLQWRVGLVERLI